ncbi:hypothetical protein H5410_046550 [Solanum commersonii]|uniref:Uncharacterized protein n=1 Tax=Solanum commersonii TaxID=4109 RepID=A0A9J5XFU0_SOLCO|nr:hypothetical protein H5410_046550 [Solanum commersonii]
MAFRKSGDFSYKESTDVVFVDLSHVGLITRRKFKNSGLDRFEYFTSLETMKNNNSNMMVVTATPGANLASVFFGELSQIGPNFGESDDSMDSPTSMNVNALMADSTDMDEKFAMMEQTIESLRNPTRRTVSMIELIGTKQRKDEPVVDYINRWRSLSLDCKDCLSDIYMLWKYAFKELATRVHDIELSTASHGKASHFADLRKEKKEFKKGMTSKIQTKESMAVKATFVKVTAKKKLKEEEALSQYLKEERQRPTLKELEAKVYPFPDSDVPIILDELLAKKVIDLPKSKRPEEINKVGDTNTASSIASLVTRQKVRKPITLDEFFPEKFPRGNQFGATHVVSSTDETKESKGEHNPAITQEHQTDEKFSLCCATIAFIDDDLLLGYNFSNPAKLGELNDDVTGFSLLEPFKISSKKEKEITSSHHTSVEKTKESNEDEEESSEQMEGDATISKNFVFHCLGSKKEVIIRKDVVGARKSIFCDVTDNKEIHSFFTSRMKRKTVLSITTDGLLKFHEKTKKEQGEAIKVFLGSQREDSNLIQSSNYIIVEEGPHNDNTNVHVQEAPPQLEDDSYREMSGLSPRIAIHHLGIKNGTRPIKQSQQVFHLELVTQIEMEVNKLIEAGFIQEVKPRGCKSWSNQRQVSEAILSMKVAYAP